MTDYICITDQPGQINGQLNCWQPNRHYHEYRLYWEDRGVRYPTASFTDTREFVRQKIAECCGMHLHIRDDVPGNLTAFFTKVDGPGRVLAQHYLPGPDTSTDASRKGEWDNAERPEQAELNWVSLHEICHGLGLGHYTGGPGLMNPTLNMGIYPHVDQHTIKELQARYGPPRSLPPEVAPPTGVMIPIPKVDLEIWLETLDTIKSGISKYL
jgi:hypothetical protein